jgi:putative Mn2+ efflux pump MntP
MTNLSTVIAILAGAVIVLSGLAALTRAIWRSAQDLRDNKNATLANTTAIVELSTKMDGRITSLEARMLEVERKERGEI